MSTLYNSIFKFSGGYKHFNSWLEDFVRERNDFKIVSINNHAIDLNLFGDDFRLTRFIRDPRDMVVSGYHYHKRGAEEWCNVVDPTPEYFKAYCNGVVPEGMKPGDSFSSYLQGLSEEDGLCAEIEFRTNHFRSMGQWPIDDSRIRLYRYEDILGREVETFDDIFRFYELSWPARKLGRLCADRFSAKSQARKTQHIRNYKPSQWKGCFTPKVIEYFNQRFTDILERYDYTIE